MRDRLQPRLGKNIAYVAQLFALREWYRQVRLARLRSDDPGRPPIEAALEILGQAIDERRKQLVRFAEERGAKAPDFALDPAALPRCPWDPSPSQDDHLAWVQGLDAEQRLAGRAWLQAIVDQVVAASSPH